MGAKARPKQKALGGKLLRIRERLGLSQSELLKRLGAENLISYKQISKYETGVTEPPLIVLLKYARVVNVSTDVLIDDELDLPAKISSATKKRATKKP
jgi:transcriptional regulator with XRE-family HTH domain